VHVRTVDTYAAGALKGCEAWEFELEDVIKIGHKDPVTGDLYGANANGIVALASRAFLRVALYLRHI
jgi:hypothetical protein